MMVFLEKKNYSYFFVSIFVFRKKVFLVFLKYLVFFFLYSNIAFEISENKLKFVLKRNTNYTQLF